MDSKKRYTFPCGRWLARSEDDGNIIREMPAEGENIRKPQICMFFPNDYYRIFFFSVNISAEM